MNIHDYPNLCASLGIARVDAIAFHLKGQYKPYKARERVVDNPHRETLMWQRFCEDSAVEDILVGICRLGEGTEQGLNPARLFTLLASAKRISSALIGDVLQLNERQARRYMAAVKLAIFHLSRHYAKQPQEESNE